MSLASEVGRDSLTAANVLAFEEATQHYRKSSALEKILAALLIIATAVAGWLLAGVPGALAGATIGVTCVASTMWYRRPLLQRVIESAHAIEIPALG